MKLFSPGRPELSAVAKPRLGDTDQRACEFLPAKTIKLRRVPTAPFHGWVPASFAQVCRAEADVSLFTMCRTRMRDERVWSEGKKEESSKWKIFEEVTEREVECAWHDVRAYGALSEPLRTNPSVCSDSLRFSPTTLQRDMPPCFEPSFGNYDIATLYSRRNSIIIFACFVKCAVAWCVSKKEITHTRGFEELRSFTHNRFITLHMSDG